MSSTNKTSHYELSQFIGTDKPAWLTDYNGDMLKIDTGLAAAAAEASGAQSTATSAASAAQAAQNTANQAVTSAAANAEDLTELKGALTNTADEMTRLGNAVRGSGAIAYSDYAQSVKLSIGWTAKPDNSAVYDQTTRIPLYSIPGNIYKVATSTITDGNSKISGGFLTTWYNTSDNEIVNTITVNAYYDGSNTIFYAQITTEEYTKITALNNIWGSFTTLFSGNFVNLTTD